MKRFTSLLAAAATLSERRSILDPFVALPLALAVCLCLVGMGLYSKRKWARLLMSVILGAPMVALLVGLIALMAQSPRSPSMAMGATGVFALPVIALAALVAILNSRPMAGEERHGLGAQPDAGLPNKSVQPTATRLALED